MISYRMHIEQRNECYTYEHRLVFQTATNLQLLDKIDLAFQPIHSHRHIDRKCDNQNYSIHQHAIR